MSTALTVLATFLTGFIAMLFGGEGLARILMALGAFYVHLPN